MKKIVLAVLLAMAAGMAAAQGYVRIDTVIRPYIEFDYQGWKDSGNPLLIGPHQLGLLCLPTGLDV